MCGYYFNTSSSKNIETIKAIIPASNSLFYFKALILQREELYKEAIDML